MTLPDPAFRRRVEEIFDGALDRPEDEREAFVRAEAGDDTAVREEVFELLRASEQEGILDAPPVIPPDLATRLQEGLGDRYRIVEEIGRGGMAVVFLAWERKHDRRVVLKVLRPEIALIYGAERFLQEVRLVSRLTHPHILGFIDSGEVQGLLYYVMPHVQGETLRDRLEREGALPVGEALVLLDDVASALEHAHAHGVVHRDLKPDNVLCAGSHAYLMDFGVAKVVQEQGPPGAGGGDAAILPTGTGMAVGTLRYMAPEQRLGGAEVDERADIFAWGLLAREMLTGRPPSLEDEEGAGDRVGTLTTERPDVPAHLAALIAACLRADPRRRPARATELRAVVGEISSPGIGAAAGANGRPTWRRWRSPTALLGVGVSAALAILAVRGLRPAADGAGGVIGPVAVAEFRNETGDPSLDFLGRMAGDWVTQGLQEVAVAPVVPWASALEASSRPAGGGEGGADLVATLRERTGAAAVVTGSFYRVGDQIRFRAEVTDARAGRLLSSPEPSAAPLDSVEVAIRELRSRVMASYFLVAGDRRDEIPGLASHPPTFEAYRAFDRGMEMYLAQEYGPATEAFLEAWSRDTTFLGALLYAAGTAYNSGSVERVDSILALVGSRRARLGPYEEYRWRLLDALSRGDAQAALRAARQASAAAPDSRSGYNLALIALSLNRPGEALDALDALDPDEGAMRGWAQFWTQQTHALHLLGRHREELTDADTMWARHPERRVATVLRARALGALGDTAGLAALVEELAPLPAATYWSQGAAMVVAGEELLAHGHPEGAEVWLTRAAAWLDGQLATDPDNRAHRYWRGSAAYDLGRWDEAYRTFTDILGERPDDDTSRGMAAVAAARLGRRAEAERLLSAGFDRAEGTRTAHRARVAAINGDPQDAVRLFAEALRQGVDGFVWLHASGHHDLALLRDDEVFRRMMAPDRD